MCTVDQQILYIPILPNLSSVLGSALICCRATIVSLIRVCKSRVSCRCNKRITLAALFKTLSEQSEFFCQTKVLRKKVYIYNAPPVSNPRSIFCNCICTP